MPLGIPRILRLVGLLLEDFLQTDQKTVSLVGIQANQVIGHVGRLLLVCQQVDALVTHDEEMMRSQVDLVQDGDGAGDTPVALPASWGSIAR